MNSPNGVRPIFSARSWVPSGRTRTEALTCRSQRNPLSSKAKPSRMFVPTSKGVSDALAQSCTMRDGTAQGERSCAKTSVSGSNPKPGNMVSGQITKSTGGPEALEERNSVTSGIHRSVGQPARRSWGRLVCTSRKTKPLSTGSGRSMLPMSTHESTPLTDHRHGTAKNTRTRAEPIQGPRTDNHWAKPSLTKSRRDHGSKPYPPKTHVPRRASRAAPKMTNRQSAPGRRPVSNTNTVGQKAV